MEQDDKQENDSHGNPVDTLVTVELPSSIVFGKIFRH